MPAKDLYHDFVKRTLMKEGWRIIEDQFTVILPERFLWIDLYAEKVSERLAIWVEIKGLGGTSPIEALASAIGKYVLYIAALEITGIDTPLYMAVPTGAFRGVLSESIGQRIIQHVGIRLVVFDPQREAIVQWKP